MKKNLNTPEIPLCVNTIRIQNYLLPPDEVIMFDWLLIKSISFGYVEFHYSQSRIEKEIRIKRTRQDKIISLFQELKFLTVSVKEFSYSKGRVKHFHVSFDVLSDKDVLSEIIDSESSIFNNFISFMEYHSSEQKKITKRSKKDEVVSNDNSDTVYKTMNDTYVRRIKMYNNGELTNEKPKRLKSQTQLQSNRIINKRLNLLNKKYDVNTIINSFTAYTDAVFKGEEHPDNFMNLFLSYNEIDDSWTVFDVYLNKFNLNYGYNSNG